MNFCSHCGHGVTLAVPAGDTLPRHVCPACGTIHYQNPKIIAGCLPIWQEQVLLCRRAITPRLGYWTLPAGFMENGETTQQAALRETWEEAQAKVEIVSLYSLFNIPGINQVYMLFYSHLHGPDFGPGEESSEVRLFHEHEIPWQQLAFPTIERTLKHYFADRAQGRFPLRSEDF